MQNKSFSSHFQTARAFGLGLNLLFWGLPVPLGWTSTFTPYTTQGIRLLEPSRLGLISYHIRVLNHFILFTPSNMHKHFQVAYCHCLIFHIVLCTCLNFLL